MSTNHHFRQAIQTKFLPCTNFKGSRVKAIAQAGSIILSWDDALDSDENHAVAAQKLAEKYGWKGVWHGGALPHSSGYSFVISTEPAFSL